MKRRIINFTLFFSALFLLSLSFDKGYGQSNALPVMANVTPISPNAASLGKYGEIPVGYFTGVPGISVPIYEINTGSLKLPVSISYHAAGVKVEDIASWVGLGWSLNAGGVISRAVRGLADDNPGGYLSSYPFITQYVNGQMNTAQSQALLDSVADGILDSEQDMFTYNVGGESGRFVFDSTGSTVTIPNTKNKIEHGTFYGVSNSWKITDINGTQYYFTYKETTSPTIINNGSFGSNSLLSSVTSWYMSKIYNSLSTDSIIFSYESAFTGFTTIGNQTKYVFQAGTATDCASKGVDETYSINDITGYRLTQINFRNGKIIFNENTQARCDYPTDFALSSIVIENTDSSFYKKFKFCQSYLSSNGGGCDTDPENNRLFLDSLVISDHTDSIEKYRFAYNKNILLPSRRSYNQDHWGYFNGAYNGGDFVPTTNVQFNNILALVSGADRTPNSNYNQAGILTSMTYPTGGRTEFEYESNKVNDFSPNQDYVVGYSGRVFSNSSILYLDTTFTIDNTFAGTNAGFVYISINNGGGDCSMYASFSCPIVTLYMPDNTSELIIDGGQQYLPSGTYEVTIDLSGVTDQSIIDNFFLAFTWPVGAMSNSSLVHNMTVGGLRIAKITDYTAGNTKASVKKYSYWDSTDYSSGTLLSFPSYVGSRYIPFADMSSCDYTTLSSVSNYPLSTTQGSYVQYRHVKELLGETGEFGTNDYEFNTSADRVYTNFPFAPSTSLDWTRGQLIHERNYRASGAGLSPGLVKEKICAYADNRTNIYQGLKIGQSHPNPPNVFGLRNFDVEQYSNESGWFPLISDTERVYDQKDLTKYAQTIHTYAYGSNHYQPIADSSKNSKGEVVITKMKYPLDYSSLSGSDALTAGIHNLQNKNVVAPIIEKYTQIQDVGGSNNRVINALITSYKTDKPLPDTVWSTQLASGSASFTASSVASGSISKSNLYKPQVLFNKYDNTGNILQQQKVNDDYRSYIWDYLSSYPVAECINADSTNIGYTSFEADGKGGWTFSGSITTHPSAPTGKKGYSLAGGNITRSGLSSGTIYIITYWKRDSTSTVTVNSGSGTLLTAKNGWKLYSHEITGTTSLTISGTAYIDELRLYPKGALMTTYTYTPLMGLTTQCDANNRISYYEYDNFGRLKLIRDQDHKVLKRVDYKFQATNQQ